MMRHCRRLRVVSLKRAARVAAAALAATVAVAAAASPALAGTTAGRSAAGLGVTRHVILQAAMVGAAIMFLLTIGLLVLGRMSRPAVSAATYARPKPQPVPVPVPADVPAPAPAPAPVPAPDQDDHSSETTSLPSWLPETAELGDHRSAPPDFSAADDYSAGDAGLAAPSWLGLAGPLAEPDPPAASAAQERTDANAIIASRAAQPTAVDLTSSSDEEPAWPGFLALASDIAEPTDEPETEPRDEAVNDRNAPDFAELPDAPRGTEPQEHSEPAESAFSPAALRMLGADPLRQRDDDDMPPQRHQVALGDDQIEVVLAEASAAGQPSRPRAGDARLAATPYLRWAPLPYDIPDDGLAFACIGAGDEGCLFVDLAAAPGAVAITGDTDAAVRLAESIAYQLCASAPADQAISVFLVGSTIPEPHPASATSVETLHDLATVSFDSPPDATDIVFCELRSNDDAFVLARHVTNSRHHVVPIVLGHLPGAAWSFTAFPDLPLDGASRRWIPASPPARAFPASGTVRCPAQLRQLLVPEGRRCAGVNVAGCARCVALGGSGRLGGWCRSVSRCDGSGNPSQPSATSEL